jgi:hypothetical protein
MWHEPAAVSMRDNPSRTCGARRRRWRGFVTGFWFMRRPIALTVYITMVALGVSFVLGFLLHGGRGIMFATGALLIWFGRISFGEWSSGCPGRATARGWRAGLVPLAASGSGIAGTSRQLPRMVAAAAPKRA